MAKFQHEFRVPVEEPVVTVGEGPGRETEKTVSHPAFGQISASRISGGTNLYASEMRHNGFVRIEIKESVTYRSLNYDRHHAGKILVRLDMSEAQWATFVSSMNIGEGVPCTLVARETNYAIPRLPDPVSSVQTFKQEVQEAGARVKEEIQRTFEMIDNMGLSKAKTDALKSQLIKTGHLVDSTMPFIASQFTKHMEKNVEKAKQEVNAYALRVMTGAQIAAPDYTPLTIEGDADATDG